jgi:hypothetical protein
MRLRSQGPRRSLDSAVDDAVVGTRDDPNAAACLPAELMFLIAARLSPPEVVTAAQTCRAWRKLLLAGVCGTAPRVCWDT